MKIKSNVLFSLLAWTVLVTASNDSAAAQVAQFDVQIDSVRSAQSPAWEGILAAARATSIDHGGLWLEIAVRETGGPVNDARRQCAFTPTGQTTMIMAKIRVQSLAPIRGTPVTLVTYRLTFPGRGFASGIASCRSQLAVFPFTQPEDRLTIR